MKTETLVLLGVVGYLWWKHSQPAGASLFPWQGPTLPATSSAPGSGTTIISCSDPNADPVMCQPFNQTDTSHVINAGIVGSPVCDYGYHWDPVSQSCIHNPIGDPSGWGVIGPVIYD